MFANVYPVIYFDIFGHGFGPGMIWLFSMRHNLSDCKQVRKYELEPYVYI